ncbi:hypothetical protein MRB53_032884 [Persea americana]|uniref:Uncharacterized protein n=1 Tax=Persea americana TaxID=3435 RepID=A0ACC2KT10_PERAE|nr:hypothetical protein MRB53_032884 [Persea americana]
MESVMAVPPFLPLLATADRALNTVHILLASSSPAMQAVAATGELECGNNESFFPLSFLFFCSGIVNRSPDSLQLGFQIAYL